MTKFPLDFKNRTEEFEYKFINLLAMILPQEFPKFEAQGTTVLYHFLPKK